MNGNKLFLLVFIVSISGCQGDDEQRALVTPDDVVLVEVEGEPVTLPMLEYLMTARGVDEEDTEGMRELLDDLIRLRAVANRAKREGVSGRPEVRAERMIKDIEVQYVRYLEKFQRDNPVSDEQIRAAYRAQLERAGERRYRIETIEFEAQAPALAELEALGNGDLEFEQAIEKATADGRIARRTDWIDASQVPGEFAAMLEETEAGDVVDKLMPFEDNWLIVRVAETDDLTPPSLDEVRDGIRRTLTRQRSQAMIDETYEAAEITPMLPLEDAGAEAAEDAGPETP